MTFKCQILEQADLFCPPIIITAKFNDNQNWTIHLQIQLSLHNQVGSRPGEAADATTVGGVRDAQRQTLARALERLVVIAFQNVVAERAFLYVWMGHIIGKCIYMKLTKFDFLYIQAHGVIKDVVDIVLCKY